MKLVLCAVNSKYVHSSLAIWYLAASLEKYCENDNLIHVLEGTINQEIDQLFNQILKIQPDIAAFSCYIWNIAYIKQLLRRLSPLLPHTVFILGGPEVSYNPREVMEALPFLHYVLSGEGELALPQLIDDIADKQHCASLPGLTYRRGFEIISNPIKPVSDDPPSPYTEQYFKALQGRIAYLETSRGCPFSCSFCLSGQGNSVRFFDLNRTKSDLNRLAHSGTRTIKLVDRTFNCDPNRAYTLFEYIIQMAPKWPQVRFHFEVAADLFDERTLALLKTSPPGLIQMEAGLQSFYAKTLTAIHRKTNIHRLIKNLKSLLDGGNIHIHVDLIAGLPHENLTYFEQSFNHAYALAPHMLQLGFLKMLHGTELRDNADLFQYSFSPEPPYELRSNRWLDPSQVSLLKGLEDHLERFYNSGRFRHTLDYLLAQTGLTPFAFYRSLAESGHFGNLLHMSLDAYTEKVLQYFSQQPHIDPIKLRDCMAVDRLGSNSTGRLPKCLHIPDSRLKSIAAGLRKPNTKRGFALLYSCETLQVAVSDYKQADPVTGLYPVKLIPVDSQGNPLSP